MRPHNFLKNYVLPVAVFGAMTAAAVVPPFSTRSAQAAVSFPLNNWEVSSVDGAGKSFSNYCVAANAFDNGTIVIIAYEKGQKSSIAFNVQEKKFKPKEKYSVSLQFSNGSLGQFMALAENESTLILQTGTDRVLWQNLVQNSTVSLSALDVKKEYSLKQFDFVYSALNECVGDTMRAEDLKNPPSSNAVITSTDSKILQRLENKNIGTSESYASSAQNFAVDMPKGYGAVSKGTSTTPSSIGSTTSEDPAVKYINSLLTQSAVVVTEVDKAPIHQDDYLRYSWTTAQNLKGKFEQVYWPSDKSFHDLVQNYFQRNDMTCNSDFLPMTNEAYRVGDIALADGQAFCMKTGDDSVALTYLFFGIGNTFTAIEHRGRFDQLEVALSVRENIRQTVEFIAGGNPGAMRPLPTALPVAHNTVSSAAQDANKSRFVKPELPLDLYSQ